MKLFKFLTALGVVALLALLATPGMRAGGNDVWNHKTTLTFAQPFEIPGGRVLPAGTYVFELLDSPYDRDIVQIFNQEQTHVYATVIAIPNYRLHSPEATVMNFAERAAGSPQAIKAWFHPGERWGHEFVYPKARAVELAKLENEPVPAMPAEVVPEAAAAPEAKEEVTALENAPLTAEEPSGEELPLKTAFAPEAATLPKTASSMPLFGLIGLVSLAAAFGLLTAVRRIS